MQKGVIINNYGISPVVASILLVLIAVSLGINLYHFFSSVKEESEASAEAKVRQDITRVLAEIKIIRVDTSTSPRIFIQNSGGRILHNVKIYINSTPVGEKDLLDVGSLWVYNYSGNLSSGDVIFVTTIERASDKYEIY